MSTDNIFVFLGPTLSIDIAKRHLPNATYLPPIKAGDILHLLRLKPEIIVIIDGYFEHACSVRHKEILLALEKGIIVAGASSMGAIRASELDTFGMVGIGEIYQHFHDNFFYDDSNVAVLHGDQSTNYQPLTAAKYDSPEKADMFYQQRLSTHSETSQKSKDAIKLLKMARDNQLPVNQCCVKAERSLFLRTQIRNSQCSAFPYPIDNLSTIEQQAQLIAKDASSKWLFEMMSQLLAVTYDLSKVDEVIKFKCSINSATLKICDSKQEHSKEFNERLNSINRFIQFCALKENRCSIKTYEHWINILMPVNDKADCLNAIKITAILWHAFDMYISHMKLTANSERIQKFSEDFRNERGLLTAEKTREWLNNCSLKMEEFNTLMCSLSNYNYLILQNNMDILTKSSSTEDIFWFGESILISDCA